MTQWKCRTPWNSWTKSCSEHSELLCYHCLISTYKLLVSGTHKGKALAKSRKNKPVKEFQRDPEECMGFFESLASDSLYGNKEEGGARKVADQTTNPGYFFPLSKPQVYPFCPQSKKLSWRVESRWEKLLLQKLWLELSSFFAYQQAHRIYLTKSMWEENTQKQINKQRKDT